ncbi:MAG: DUF4212 domain-containing protein [Phycisphaeraceae bacterium]
MNTLPRREGLAEARRVYWRANLWLMSGLLCVWAFVSFGLGIFLADVLNAYSPFGVPLGFWFAQQGSIVTFVVLILIYAVSMNRLDRWYHEVVTREHLRPHDDGGSN